MKKLKLNHSIVFAILLGVLFSGSCNEDIKTPCKLEDVSVPFLIQCKLSSDVDTVKMYIDGTWTWLQEERAQKGQPTKYLTPHSEGYSLELKLQNDTATYSKCGQIAGVYKFAITKLKDITGTNFPEDEEPVLVYYDLNTGVRDSYVPLVICQDYCVLQYQFVSSIVGPHTFHKILK